MHKINQHYLEVPGYCDMHSHIIAAIATNDGYCIAPRTFGVSSSLLLLQVK